jgi:predicted restriction endonuclease
MCCTFCRLGDDRLLVASHIIPWIDDETRRADPRNGLSLCALHDRAFDRGLMSVGDDLSILVSRQLLDKSHKAEMHRVAFVAIKGERMTLLSRFAPDPAALAYHRKHKFEAERCS